MSCLCILSIVETLCTDVYRSVKKYLPNPQNVCITAKCANAWIENSETSHRQISTPSTITVNFSTFSELVSVCGYSVNVVVSVWPVFSLTSQCTLTQDELLVCRFLRARSDINQWRRWKKVMEKEGKKKVKESVQRPVRPPVCADILA